MNAAQGRKIGARCAAAAMSAGLSVALSQELPPAPVFPTAPQEQVPVYAEAPQLAPPPAQSGRQSFKKLFAGTLATVAQATGTTLVVGLTQAITGGITDWFNRKQTAQGGSVPVQVLPPPSLPPTPAVTQIIDAPALPPPQYFDAQSGAPAAPDPVFSHALAAPAEEAPLFAGLAFEVHSIGAGGATVPVNPATHEFRDGDRFVVFYRPTMPGRMSVVNVNPAGMRNQIDEVDVAAGQLAQLGPYEFTAMKGEERLVLILSPCQTPALLAQTRDIVNVAVVTAPAPAFGLAGCSPVTRSVREVETRDIRKVAVEGTTGFALDPLSAAEFSSGQVAPREVTIVFRHR